MGLARARFAALGALTCAAVATFAASAGAAASGTPVAVVAIESDDAESLAESLTVAVERGVDRAPGWREVHVRESLSTLSFAFKCPARPDPACLDRVAQHLGVDVIVWGTMSRAAEGRFDASLHLWRRRGPGSEATARLTLTKDPSHDPAVDAQGLAFARNLLAPLRSALTVKAAFGAQAVLRVDGVNRGPFVDDSARVELEAGPHRIEVARGFEVLAGREVDLRGDEDVAVVLEAVAAPERGPVGPAPTPAPLVVSDDSTWKKATAYGTLGVGGALGIAAIVEAVKFSGHRDDLDQSLALIPRSVTDVCATDVVPNAVLACRSYRDAQTARTLGFVLGAVSVVAIGGGAALLWQATQDVAPAQPRIGFVPRAGGGEISFVTPMD